MANVNAFRQVPDTPDTFPGKVELQIHASRAQSAPTAPIGHTWDRVDGSVWMQRHDDSDGALLRLPGLADFLINATGKKVDAWPAPGISDESCRQLHANSILPMALSRQGRLVLHASAVDVDGQAIVFVGVSGRGKSTLAASFATAGYALIADDGLEVQVQGLHPQALPGDAQLRLWQDSSRALASDAVAVTRALEYTDKLRYTVGTTFSYCGIARPVCAIYLLEPPMALLTGTTISRMSPAEALATLIKYSFLLDVGRPLHHASLMQRAAGLANLCPVFQLMYPRDYAMLPQIHQAILENTQMTPCHLTK